MNGSSAIILAVAALLAAVPALIAAIAGALKAREVARVAARREVVDMLAREIERLQERYVFIDTENQRMHTELNALRAENILLGQEVAALRRDNLAQRTELERRKAEDAKPSP